MARKDVTSQFLRDHFDPDDRLAIVLVNRQSGAVIQRLASARQIAADEFQAWLRYQNAQRYEVYCTMNALIEVARGRTKADVGTIRHIYLDFDHDGTAAVESLIHRTNMPKPNVKVNTSPDKWQVFWQVTDFAKAQAESLMRALVREFGADPAATDCSRVMRLPGFCNYKYAHQHYVRIERLAGEVYTPEHFPPLGPGEGTSPALEAPTGRRDGTRRTGQLSQSELDWAYAKRALARGESPSTVVTAIANYRRGEKHDLLAYAERTVQKAKQSLAPRPSDLSGPHR